MNENFSEDKIEQQRERKQIFLRDEIIDKNFDGGDFAEFLMSKKQEGFIKRRKCR